MALKDPGSIIQYRGPFKGQIPISVDIGSFKHCRIGISISQDDFMKTATELSDNGKVSYKPIKFYINDKEFHMGQTHIYQYLDHPLENFKLSFDQPMPASTTVDIVYCQKQQES